jgi:hypothetical protein
LRGYFQKFLTNNCTEETLLFWEYAEDYWRAHPYSQQPFAAASGAFGRASGGSVPVAGTRLDLFWCEAVDQAMSNHITALLMAELEYALYNCRILTVVLMSEHRCIT